MGDGELQQLSTEPVPGGTIGGGPIGGDPAPSEAGAGSAEATIGGGAAGVFTAYLATSALVMLVVCLLKTLRLEVEDRT